MAFFDLTIRVIDPSLDNRNMFRHVLGQIGQPDVLLQKDARELFNRDKPLPCDLVLINTDLNYGLSAPDIIRYLSRANLVPQWCKFVIVTQESDYRLSAPIFRYLQTEILQLPVSFDQMRYLVFRTITSIQTFKPILSKLHQIAPHELVKMVTSIHTKQNDSVLEDELLVMKLQLLMKARKPDLALKLAAKIRNPACRFREQVYVNMVTGQEDELSKLISETKRKKQFLHGRVYLQTYQYVTDGEFSKALICFQNLPIEKMRGNDSYALALLMQQVIGLKGALDFLDYKIKLAPHTSMDYNQLVAAKTKLYFIALVTGELDQQSEFEIYLKVQDLADHRIWQKGEFKFSAFAPFLELGIVLHDGKGVAEDYFNRLFLQLNKMDVTQLNIMLYAANKLGRDNASMEIHEQLEMLLAKVELSPELIAFLIVNDVVLRSSMDADRLKYRLEYLGLTHWQSGRHYRALTRFKELISKFDQSSETIQQMRRLIRDSGLKRYWRYEALP